MLYMTVSTMLLPVLVIIANLAAVLAAPSSFTLVNNSGASTTQTVAVYTCQGLYNREPSTTAVYVLASSVDEFWLNATAPQHAGAPAVGFQPFINDCLATFTTYVRYNMTAQQKLLPSIVSIASDLNAVPMDIADIMTSNIGNATVAFDAITIFNASFTELESTAYAFDHHSTSTTGIAKLNPGWHWDAKIVDQLKPTFGGDPSIELIDYVVKERLFLFYLPNGCVPLAPEHILFERMLSSSPVAWGKKPLRVYGYDNTHPLFGGDLFEAETTCSNEHNLGQIASEGVTNLAYFSRSAPITEPLLQPEDPPATAVYNQSKTYIAFIMGDGDNVEYIQHSRAAMMRDRASRCAAGGGAANATACFPLLWSINPNLQRMAPDWLKWYWKIANITQRDYFVLPPSGDTYSYPSLENAADQATFVTRTEEDCRILNTSASVSWEEAASWEGAIKGYYPRYANNGVVRSFYAVNVPYLLPVLAFGVEEHYKVLGGGDTPAVLFKPMEWRGSGVRCTGPPGVIADLSKYTCPTPAEMGERINDFKKGTVTHIYLTSDGGAGLATLYELVPFLEEHVAVVNMNQLSRFALERTPY